MLAASATGIEAGTSIASNLAAPDPAAAVMMRPEYPIGPDDLPSAPQGSALVKERASQHLTVEGAVTTRGIYPIRTRLPLLQAIAPASGPIAVANEHQVFEILTSKGVRYLARFDLEPLRDGIVPDPELQGEDVVMVDESAGKARLRRFIELTPLIGIRSAFR